MSSSNTDPHPTVAGAGDARPLSDSAPSWAREVLKTAAGVGLGIVIAVVVLVAIWSLIEAASTRSAAAQVAQPVSQPGSGSNR